MTNLVTGASKSKVASEVEAKPGAQAAQGLWHYIGVALSGALLLVVVALAVMLIVIPKVAGGIPLTVLTSSMEPGLPPGTLIVVRPVNPDDLRIGDVVTYQIQSGKAGVITHRITAIASSSDGTRSFTFQGDNNGAPDSEQIIEAQIHGRLWYSVPFVGYVNSGVNGPNKTWIIPVAAGLLLTYAGYMIASGTVAAAKNRRKAGDPATDATGPGSNPHGDDSADA